MNKYVICTLFTWTSRSAVVTLRVFSVTLYVIGVSYLCGKTVIYIILIFLCIRGRHGVCYDSSSSIHTFIIEIVVFLTWLTCYYSIFVYFTSTTETHIVLVKKQKMCLPTKRRELPIGFMIWWVSMHLYCVASTC